MRNLKKQLIKLGHQNPELRKDLRPILDVISKQAAAPYGSEEAMWEKIDAAYRKISDSFAVVYRATEVGSGGARKLGLSYGASELIDVLKENRRHLLDLSRSVEQRDRRQLEQALRQFKQPLDDFVGSNMYRYKNEWLGSGDWKLEAAAPRLLDLRDALHTMWLHLED